MYGPMGGPDSDDVHVNFVRSDYEKMLSKQLEHLHNAEFGDTLVDEQSLLFEDRRAKQIMDESVALVNGHYQLELPFWQSPPYLPDSLPDAKKRLYWLEKKMERDPEFHKCYASVVNKYQEEASLRQVPDREVVGVSFAADIIRCCHQFILLLRECTTSYTTSSLVPDEKIREASVA